MLMEELKNEKNGLRWNNQSSYQSNPSAHLQSLLESDFKKTEEFYKKFASSLKIFDPMDRPIENDEGENVATNSSALLK